MMLPVAKRMVLVTIILMDLLTGMEFDLFAPSLTQLQSYFHLSPSWVEAVLSVNFVGYCLSLLFIGDLADRYGRKSIILLGLLIFVVGSSLCLWANTYPLFLTGRFLQGVGVAAPAILSFLIIADAYPLKEQQFLMAMLNGSLNIAAAVAPVIGSYLTLYFSWEGNFVALLILGLISGVMTIAFIPLATLPLHKETFSLRSYFSLFQSKPLWLLMITILFICIPYWVFVGISPLLYIKDLGVSLKHFGYYQGILAFLFALGSILYGLMIRNRDQDQKRMLWISMQILLVSLLAIIFVTFINSSNPLFITLALLVFVVGQIIPITVLYPLCLNRIPHAKARISAIIQGSRLVLSSLALQIMGYFYQGSFKNIGILISGFILIAIISLFLVIKDYDLTYGHDN